MRVAVTGASGVIGSALVPALRNDGYDVLRLVRGVPTAPDERRWEPAVRLLDPAVLSDVDAVVHLAGAGVADRRWTDDYKRTIRDSRVDGTLTVAEALARATPRPRVLLSASAVGYYGDRGDDVVDESAPPGEGFLPEVCQEWEAATAPAADAGVRVVLMRTGLVCSPRGGLLDRMVPLFKLGLGGKLGSGRQYQPWISLRDEVDAIRFLLVSPEISGPANLTGPVPVTNAEFTRALAEVLHRPAVLPVPRLALRTVLGPFADEGVLAGQRAVPAVLSAHGFAFTDPDVRSALRWATAG
ncbi:MAG TPA: TIGR01777 family oxidoreductase [Cryptosporangiaceae bacterium]|nr:TIGR01777 family oxidoreductase [Cryptosporangiaceae bacterium]